MPETIDRRTLIKLLAGSAMSVGLFGCEATGPPAERLARLLGLSDAEQEWLVDLTIDDQAELAGALAGPGNAPMTPRTIDLATKIIGRRSRLFAFVGYPGVPDARSVCDGLVRE